MLRLFKVECRRDLSRRLTRMLIFLFVAVVTVGVGIAWVKAPDHSTQERDALLDRAVERCVEDARYNSLNGATGTVEIEPGVFIDTPTPDPSAQPSDPEARDRCESLRDAWVRGDPEGEQFYYLWDDTPVRATDLWNAYRNEEGLMSLPQSLLMVVAMAAAASMIGAEWKAGTVTTQLTWYPRRVNLFIVKVVAACVLAAVIAYVLQAYFALLLTALLSAKGADFSVVDHHWVLNLLGGMARTSFLVAIAAALGASLAMVFRNTAGAIIVVFAYVAVGESLLRIWQPDWARWFVGDNLAIVVSGHSPEGLDWEKGLAAAALTLLVYALAAVAAAAVTFRTRDIASSA